MTLQYFYISVMVMRVEQIIQRNSISFAEKIRPKSVSQKARDIILSYVPDGKPLTKEQQDVVPLIFNRRRGFISNKICEYYEQRYNNPISEAHKKLLGEFYQDMSGKIDSKLLKTIKMLKTEGDLKSYLMKFPNIIGKLEIDPVYKEVMKHKKSGFPLEYEQMLYKKICFAEETIAKLYRMFARHSTEPEIANVEKILKEKYGCDAFLNDDYTKAEHILKSVQKLEENNIPIPKEYIVTDYIFGGRALRTEKHTVLLGSSGVKSDFLHIKRCKLEQIPEYKQEEILIDEWTKQCGFSNFNSSSAKEHIETHEAMHFLHLPFLAFMQQKTNNFTNTIKKLSGYAAEKARNCYEIFAELKAKSLYEPLNSNEQHLLNILEGKN